MTRYTVYGHFVTGYAISVTANSEEEALEKGIALLKDGQYDNATDGSWKDDFEVID